MDESGFRTLYERSARPLRAYLRRMTSDPDLADDVLQDTYVRFLAADVPPMTKEQTLSYLYTTATRLVYDRWRRRSTERRWWEREAAAGAASAAPPEPPGLRRDVDAALARLAPRDRALVWLAYAEGRSHREIAAILEVGEKSVRVMLFRARRRLAKVLEEHGLTPEVLS